MARSTGAAAAAIMALLGLAFAAQAAPEQPPQPVTMPALPADAKPQPVALSRLIVTIEDGHQWITFNRVFFECAAPKGMSGITWNSAGKRLDPKFYDGLISSEMEAAGFKLANDPSSLFQTRDDSDLKLAGNLKNADAMLCMHLARKDPEALEVNGKRYDLEKATGSIHIEINWQLYSNIQKKIVLNKSVNTETSLAERAPGNLSRLAREGIRENVRALIASDEFRQVVLAPVAKPSVKVAENSPLMLTGSLGAKPARISDAVGSVVLIMSGGGHGSGFMISTDGYVMTAQHVVGADKYVKIRWSDGLEGVGEVVRTDKRRDVALIKADSRGRAPLALHRDMPQPGDTVFSIGAPIDPKLQNTVTRGVASANRIMDGFSFIQSDVTVDPGNSGGPLLDEKGEVLGLTDIGIRTPEAPTGLNFFIPIRDALDFLSLDQR